MATIEDFYFVIDSLYSKTRLKNKKNYIKNRKRKTKL